MDGKRFDVLAREWATARSRRVFGSGLLAFGIGGGLALGRVSQSDSRKRKKKGKKKKSKPPTGCATGTVLCGETCVATASDPANCGRCGVRCGPDQACCSGQCRNLMADEQHCSACGAECPTGKTCCGGMCRDLEREPDNCGGCGVGCQANEICLIGTCTPCTVCDGGCPASFVQEAVNAADPGDTIVLCPGTWSGAVTIRKDLSIIGAGSEATGSILTEPGMHESLVLIDDGTTVELKYLAVVGSGDLSSNSSIRNNGRLTLTECHVRDQVIANIGGGIFNAEEAELTLRRTTVSGNRVSHSAGKGGGIFNNGGTVTLEQSEVRNNVAGESGGGIHNEPSGVVTLVDSRVSGNEAGIRGGGIANYGVLALRNTAVQENQGGGLYNFGSVTLDGTSRVVRNVPFNCQGTAACSP